MLRDKRWPLALALGGSFLAFCGGCGRHPAEPPPAVAVQAAVLKREPVLLETRFSATVRERQRIELSFKVPGTVAALLQVNGPDGKLHDLQEGDTVTSQPERPLATLDDSDYKRRVSAARDQLAQVEAKQRAALAAVIALRANFQRTKALRQSGSVAQQTYDEVLAKRDSAEAELEAAHREGSSAATALQQAEDDWEHCGLRLPIPKAVVSRKFVEKGERVPAGQPVFQVMDLSELHVAFGVPDTRIGQFQLGQRVTVMADAFRGEQFSGRITKISPAADLRTRTFEVEVTINEPRQLKPGMVVTIILGQQEEMVLVPMTAVARGATLDDLTVFAVVEENGRAVARRRPVRLDGVYDNRIRLIEGPASKVKVGDAIVVTGTFRLTDGQPVRVYDVPAPIVRLGD
jgi:multidrug efflux system membrane fusion protein